MGKFAPKLPPAADVIEIRGARQNNLKGFDLDLPLGKLIVVSGPSGCGKSSLAFDTVYAEGQRRYVETFSPYTRQFFERMDKPKVDAIRGIPPAIAIEQANSVKTTRSTVGTITEINDYLKQLLPRVVQARCPKCERKVCPETAQSIAAEIYQKFRGERLLVTFSIPAPEGTPVQSFFEFIQAQGYLRVLIESEILRLDEPEKVSKLPTLVQVIQDRMAVTEENRARMSEALETALRFGKGRVCVVGEPGQMRGGAGKSDICEPFSTGWHCAHCDLDIIPPSPGLFSFNNPQGACPRCRGFGRTIAVDLERALPDRRLSIAGGVIKPFQSENGQECQKDLLAAAKKRRLNVNVPFHHLLEHDQNWVIYGERTAAPGESLADQGLWYGIKGFFDWLETKTYKMHVRVLLARYRTYTTCPDCRGGRYQVATMNFRWQGLSLPDLQEMPVGELARWVGERRAEILGTGDLPEEKAGRALKLLLESVESRLRYLADVGLGYLTLDRTTRSLSGGELERVNLTTCLGASLVNTLFVLDEPSVGLHPRDTGRLIRIMRQLRDRGNTLLVVEHEEAVLRAADHLVELGPGRGAAGGDLVYNGSLQALPTRRGRKGLTLTAEYLGGTKSIPVPAHRRTPQRWIEVRGAREHNLAGGDFRFPLGVFGCVTGVSGSGKSTLVHSILYRKLQEAKGLSSEEAPGECDEIVGHEQVAQVVMVDQSPLSRTPRSSPAVYLGVFDAIRELFAQMPDAQAQGFTSSTFSFNSGNGRCERCAGSGFEKIEMQFLSDVYVRCPECEGRRYQAHVLKVELQGKSIQQVLEMTVGEAIAFFTKLGAKKVAGPLGVLEEVGLGYLTLGQPLNVLSGGESQRLKLVERLTQREGEAAMLILDEPTTGLHFDDVATLMRVFDRLVEKGNSLLVIEHNTEVIKCADYVLDLGPEAGREGGQLVAAGTPEEIAAVEASHTGRYLRAALGAPRAAGAGQSGVLPTEQLASLDGARPSSDVPLYEQDILSDSTDAELRVAEDIAAYGRGAREIVVHGAREHNLKNIDVTVPRDQLVVITGLSGSGKSTLAFDILFAEGQRRFLDSMSAYARQFVEQLEKPEVDHISGLPPTVAIEQRITRGGGKSTVATVTEVYHFLRLLWAKLGTQYCPKCDLPVEKQTLAAAVNKARDIAKRGKVRVVAPLVKARKGFHTEVANWAVRHGFTELLVDGKWMKAQGMPKLERFREHTIDVLVGENPKPEEMPALIKRAVEIGKGTARVIDAKNETHIVSTEMSCPGCGQSFEELDPRLFSFNSPHGWCQTCKGFGEVWKHYVNKRLNTEAELEMDQERQHLWLEEGEAKPCPECFGARINEVARHVRLRGRSLDEIAGLSSKAALDWSATLKFTGNSGIIAADILPEIAQRLSFMEKVGLDYLALGRSAKTLSGGESQRIRLAAQLGSTLRGVLYVLDEPTIGLHARDNARLLDTLEALKAKGNSLVIVEHDEETMRRADHIIDLGPGAGRQGGVVVAQGTLKEIEQMEASTTGAAFRNLMQHPVRGSRRSLSEVDRWIEVRGARLHNLKEIDVRVPVGRLTVLTGISGSGKSTFMRGVLKPLAEEALRRPAKRRVRKKGEEADARGELVGLMAKGGDAEGTGILDFGKGTLSSRWKRSLPAEVLEAVYEVDQSPIGKTSRSTPATYIKVFDTIRELYAQMPVARIRGYTGSRFSFNTEGGRCETCTGQGVIKIEMNFLPTSYLPCPDCGGKRYNAATQEVLFNEKSIGDVMEMTLADATEFFSSQSKIHRPLKLLCDTGLGYLQLGQASPTLSGGEAQRLKLVAELSRGSGRTETARMKSRATKSMLYLLEEPTIGLHLRDVQKLLDVLHRLVDDGATVVVIEHHLNLVAEADYVIDIGPEAGPSGGEIVACGTPEQVATSKESRTAPFLREVLQAGKSKPRKKGRVPAEINA